MYLVYFDKVHEYDSFIGHLFRWIMISEELMVPPSILIAISSIIDFDIQYKEVIKSKFYDLTITTIGNETDLGAIGFRYNTLFLLFILSFTQ